MKTQVQRNIEGRFALLSIIYQSFDFFEDEDLTPNQKRFRMVLNMGDASYVETHVFTAIEGHAPQLQDVDVFYFEDDAKTFYLKHRIERKIVSHIDFDEMDEEDDNPFQSYVDLLSSRALSDYFTLNTEDVDIGVLYLIGKHSSPVQSFEQFKTRSILQYKSELVSLFQ